MIGDITRHDREAVATLTTTGAANITESAVIEDAEWRPGGRGFLGLALGNRQFEVTLGGGVRVQQTPVVEYSVAGPATLENDTDAVFYGGLNLEFWFSAEEVLQRRFGNLWER